MSAPSSAFLPGLDLINRPVQAISAKISLRLVLWQRLGMDRGIGLHLPAMCGVPSVEPVHGV
jgi:hypothetical protein